MKHGSSVELTRYWFAKILPHLFQTMTVISIAALLAAYQFMAFMSKTTLSDTGALLDSGSDLNIEGGIAE